MADALIKYSIHHGPWTLLKQNQGTSAKRFEQFPLQHTIIIIMQNISH